MVAPTAPAPSGILGALRALGDGLLASAQERLALLALEVKEEKFRLIQTLVWIAAALFAGAMAIAFASLTLVYCFPAGARLAVLAGLTLFYLVALLALVGGLRRFLATQPEPFAATLQELAKDRACIPPKR